MELNVCDTQPSCLGGGNNEFIYSGRLDNLASCYCALRSLMDSSKMAEQLSNEKAIRMVAMFDNEEVRCIHKSDALHEHITLNFTQPVKNICLGLVWLFPSHQVLEGNDMD
jgi:hypothetical protein